MAQWVNHLRNKIFVNPPPLPLLCEISGALHPVLRQAGRRNTGEFRNFKVGCRSKYSTCRFVNQGTASFQPYQCIPAGFFG